MNVKSTGRYCARLSRRQRIASPLLSDIPKKHSEGNNDLRANSTRGIDQHIRNCRRSARNKRLMELI
jgi:hypothetical protein